MLLFLLIAPVAFLLLFSDRLSFEMIVNVILASCILYIVFTGYHTKKLLSSLVTLWKTGEYKKDPSDHIAHIVLICIMLGIMVTCAYFIYDSTWIMERALSFAR
jgi:Ca2+/Na+ antiporter